MAEEEKKIDVAAIRDSILSKYAQAGLTDKDAAEKADAFLREHAFRPHAAEINPQLAGLMERAAEAARQQAGEKKSAEQEKAAPAAAPAEEVKEAPVQQAERKPANKTTVEQFAADLKEITGMDWEAKRAVGYDETQGKAVSYDRSLCVPATPEMVAKLEEKGIRYSNLEDVSGKNFIAVDTTKPLYLTNEEINKKTYAAELKEITGAEWVVSQGLDPKNADIFQQKEALCVIKTPEMIAKLEEKGIRYGGLITGGEAEVIAVDIDKPLYLTKEEMKEKNKTMEAAAKEGEEIAPAQPVVEDVKVAQEEAPVFSAGVKSAGKVNANTDEQVKPAQDKENDAPVFSAGVKTAAGQENQGSEEDLDELEAQLFRTAWKNKFMLLEDEEAEKDKEASIRHLCPFSQCLPETVRRSKNPPYVSMNLASGSTVTNGVKRVNMDYEGDTPSFEDCMTMARIGMEKGWKSAKLEGSDEYKSQMYLAMRAMGIKVIGYTPSPELEKQGDEFAAKHEQDRQHAESMDQRYPALEQARGNADFDKLDAEQYKAIRAKAEGKETAQQTEERKNEKPAEEKKVEAPAKTAESVPAEKPVEEKKAELSGKFDKMLSTLREQHPNVVRKTDFNGKRPAELLQAYGNALNVVKTAEAKGSVKAAPNKANVLNAAKNRSGEGR